VFLLLVLLPHILELLIIGIAVLHPELLLLSPLQQLPVPILSQAGQDATPQAQGLVRLR
jgi:hypothetical protein